MKQEATLCFVVQGEPFSKVLLGLKKGGFGEGKFDGFGGKIEAGETPLAAAIRELEEESGLKAMPEHVQYVAHLVFVFPAKPEWSQIVHAFVATQWTGTPAETVEMIPNWFDLPDIPYARMWDDSAYWLPRILAGGRVRGRFVFQPDNATVGHLVLEPLDELSASQLAARAESQPADWAWGRHWTDGRMATNIEIKARVSDIAAVKAIAERLSDRPCTVLLQEDTFFHSPQGRLKLRVLGPDRGQLIYYERADAAGPKRSEYFVSPTADPASLKAVLAPCLGVRGVVRKRRSLFWVGNARVHLDEVEGLGSFLELEVMLGPRQSEEEGQAIARELMSRLGVQECDLIEGAYMDLLEGS